jgi:hypothetical protein
MENMIDRLSLQRLVDGELTERQQREFLARLDDDPHSWRRLALAFVEEQIWGREYRAAAREASAVSPAPALPERLRRAGTGRLPWRVVAAAAGVFVAWLIGVWQGGTWQNAPSPAPSTAHSIASDPGRLAPSGARCLSPSSPDAPEGDRHAACAASQSPSSPGPSFREPSPRVTPADAGNGEPEPLDLPLVRDLAVQDASLPYPPFVADEVRRVLAGSGYRVQERPQIVPVRFANGQRGVVPVNQVNLSYEGLNMYQ